MTQEEILEKFQGICPSIIEHGNDETGKYYDISWGNTCFSLDHLYLIIRVKGGLCLEYPLTSIKSVEYFEEPYTILKISFFQGGFLEMSLSREV